MAKITQEKMSIGIDVRGGKLCEVKKVLEFEDDKLVKVGPALLEPIEGLPGNVLAVMPTGMN